MRKITFLFSLAFIFMIPWENVINLPDQSTYAKLFGLVLAALWLASVVLTGQIRKPHLFHIVLIIFVVWNMISVFWTASVQRSANRMVTWALILGFAYILWDLYTNRSDIRLGMQMYILGAFVAIGDTLYNYFAGSYYYYQRFSATDTNPDDLGVVLAIGIPIAWYLATSQSTSKLAPYFKLINFAFIPAAFAGISLSGTRTALIAAVPGMVFGLASLSRLKFSARITILMVVSVSIIFLLPYIPQTSFQRLSTTIPEIASGDLNQRSGIWSVTLDLFAENPILGIGGDAFRTVTNVGKVVHNSFLSVLVEVGLVGFALFFTILTIVLVEALKHRSWDKFFWLTLLAVWGIGATSLTWEHRKITWLLFSMVIASATIISYRKESFSLFKKNEPQSKLNPTGKHSNLPVAEKENSYLA